MLRTLRSRSRRFLPAAVGTGALAGGFLLLQFGALSDGSVTETPQLAAADRSSAIQTASRGGERTRPLAEHEIAAFQAAVVPDAGTTTTTEPPPTTTAAPTTTTTKPKPTTTKAPARRAQAQPSRSAPSAAIPAPSSSLDESFAALARCESGMRNVNTGNGYYGYFQFLPSTWRSLGASGLPHEHSYEVQLQYAKKLQARSGWGQWPACTRKLGLR